MMGLWFALTLAGSALGDPGPSIVPTAASSSVSQLHEEALIAFDNEDYAAAAAYWEAIVLAGAASADTHANLGTARFHEGDLPRALGAWRSARLLDPRSGDLAHNIALVRGRLEDTPEPAALPAPWLEIATPGEWGFLAFVLLSVASGGVLRRREQVPLWALCGAGGAVLATLALSGRAIALGPSLAVVIDEDAVVRTAPDSAAVERFSLVPGSEVEVLSRVDAFVRVRDGDGRSGWVPVREVWFVQP